MRAHVYKEKNKVIIKSENVEIYFHVKGVDLAHKIDPSFSVWILLPLAMKLNQNLHICENIDPVVIDNANTLAGIWSTWMPEEFSHIVVTADGNRNYLSTTRHESLHLFSGGVDSTYALLYEGKAAKERHVLTVHGLDYEADNNEQFDNLLNKTHNFLDSLGYKQIIIKTNVLQYIKRFTITHGFCLAGCLFLLSDYFKVGKISADFTWYQDMIMHPWGTNHVTNRYFSGSNYKLETVSGDVARTQKLAFLSNNTLACDSLSFCFDKKIHPGNCGTCSKCLRVKYMFIASTGSFPKIFTSNDLNKDLISKIDLSISKEYAFFSDILLTARKTGFVDKIPEIEDLVERKRKRIRRNSRLKKIMNSVQRSVLRGLRFE